MSDEQVKGDFGLLVDGQELEGLLYIKGVLGDGTPVPNPILGVVKDSPADLAIRSGSKTATVACLRNRHLYINKGFTSVTMGPRQLRSRSVRGDEVIYGEDDTFVPPPTAPKKPSRFVGPPSQTGYPCIAHGREPCTDCGHIPTKAETTERNMIERVEPWPPPPPRLGEEAERAIREEGADEADFALKCGECGQSLDRHRPVMAYEHGMKVGRRKVLP